jgi:hypothetical protein
MVVPVAACGFPRCGARADSVNIVLMSVFVVERHLVGWTRAEVDLLVRRLEEVAGSMAAAGVRYLGSLVLPTDEICLGLFEASDAGAVAAANRDQGLRVDRILSGWTSHLVGVA